MVGAVLWKTDGDIGSIRELGEVRVFSEVSEDGGDDGGEIFCAPIQRRHEAVVGERRFKNLVERLLASDVLSSPENRCRGCF